MEPEDILGLELLMNSKKKQSSDAISVSSSRSAIVEPVDVREHLTPPSQSNTEEDNSEYEEDDYSTYEEDVPQQPQQQQPKFFQYNPTAQPAPAAPRMSDEDIINEKKEILYQFERLEKKGVRLPRKFTLASSLEEMRFEYERIKKDREIDASVKFQRRLVMTAVSGIEFAADQFPRFGVQLNGWSSQVHDDLDDFDPIFEELHDKYKGKAKMAPEVRLLASLGGSAFMFHMRNKFSNELPGLDSVLKSNPQLAAQLAEATRNQMKSQQQQQNGFFSGLGNMFGNIFNGAAPPPEMPEDMKPRTKMQGPSNIDDILEELNELNTKQQDRVEMMSNISASEIPEDDESVVLSGIVKKSKGKRSIDLDI